MLCTEQYSSLLFPFVEKSAFFIAFVFFHNSQRSYACSQLHWQTRSSWSYVFLIYCSYFGRVWVNCTLKPHVWLSWSDEHWLSVFKSLFLVDHQVQRDRIASSWMGKFRLTLSNWWGIWLLYKSVKRVNCCFMNCSTTCQPRLHIHICIGLI